MLEGYDRAVAQRKDAVFSYAYYYLGNRQEAEDVTQQVLIKLWQHWARLDVELVPRWLHRVTRNASYDVLRRRKSHGRYEVDDRDGERAQRAPASTPDPHDDIETKSVRQRIRRALAELPEPYRSAMILREIQELTYREVGEVLEIPTNTAKTHVHRGRKMLRENLLEEANATTAGLH